MMSPLKILLLADPSSVHSQRWARSLAESGIEVHLAGLIHYTEKSEYLNHPNITLYSLGVSQDLVNRITTDVSKLSYLWCIPKLRKLVRELQPSLVHAHYATSYGVLGALSGSSRLLLSLWGDDVLVFPKRSLFHKLLLRFNLSQADEIFSTSLALADSARAYTDKEITIIPFGIDTEIFHPQASDCNLFQKPDIVVGTIKSLEDVYGIDYLISTFAAVVSKHPELPLKLLIVGGGSKELELKEYARKLHVDDKVVFTGRVTHEKVVQFHNALDVYLALSRSESFGVAPLESQACKKPVIVTDVGGLPEVIEHDVSGIVVPLGDIDASSAALENLVSNSELRRKMGEAGRERVIRLYSWKSCVEKMISCYTTVAAENAKGFGLRNVFSRLSHESNRKVVRSIQYLSGEKLIKLVIGLFIHAWLARYLGPENFGSLSYVVNFTHIFLPFVTFGVEEVLTKDFVAKPIPVNNIIATQINLRLVAGAIGYVIFSCFVLFDQSFEWSYKMMFLVFGLTIFLRIFDVYEAFFQSILNLRPVFWARNVGYISSAALKAVAMLYKGNVVSLLITYFWEVLVWKVLNIISYKRTHASHGGVVDLNYRRSFLSESFPLFWGAFLIMLDAKLGHIMLKKFHGDESLGHYAIVMILIDLWGFLPAAICSSLYPVIINSRSAGEEVFSNKLQLLYNFLFWFGCSFTIAVNIFSPLVVKLLYGPKYDDLIPLLNVASILGITNFLAFGRIRFYALEGKLASWMLYSGVSLLMNLVLQFYLVPSYETQGVILSMITAPFAALFICSTFNNFIRSELKIIARSALWPILFLRKALWNR